MSPKRSPGPGWFRALGRYYRDPNASLVGKLVAFVAAIYVIVPMDVIPDVPVVGWLDDLGVMGLASAWLFHAVGRYRESPRRVASPETQPSRT